MFWFAVWWIRYKYGTMSGLLFIHSLQCKINIFTTVRNLDIKSKTLGSMNMMDFNEHDCSLHFVPLPVWLLLHCIMELVMDRRIIHQGCLITLTDLQKDFCLHRPCVLSSSGPVWDTVPPVWCRSTLPVLQKLSPCAHKFQQYSGCCSGASEASQEWLQWQGDAPLFRPGTNNLLQWSPVCRVPDQPAMKFTT